MCVGVWVGVCIGMRMFTSSCEAKIFSNSQPVAKPAAIAAAQPQSNNNNSKKKSKEEYQQVVLGLSEMFPDEEINLLTAAALLTSGNCYFFLPTCSLGSCLTFSFKKKIYDTLNFFFVYSVNSYNFVSFVLECVGEVESAASLILECPRGEKLRQKVGALIYFLSVT